MSGVEDNNDWISARVEAAVAALEKDVAPETSEVLADELRARIRERPLRPQELTELAQNLIASTAAQEGPEESSCD